MLEQLRQIAIFAKVVDHGSFRAAARALDISPSVISHHVAQLEAQLGTALLYRSTRKLSVTDDGKRLLAQARVMIDAAEAGLNAVANQSSQPSGELSVTLPAVLAQSAIIDRVAAFSITHPNVRLKLDFSDSRREVIGSGIDVAIRMGWLKDSALKARKLYDVNRRLIASPSYLSGRARPEIPEDLADWDWMELSPVRQKPRFRKEGARTVTLNPTTKLSVNDANALSRLARAGAGLAIVPDFLTVDDIANGTLEQLFPDWHLDPVGVYAVWPPNAPKEGLTSFFVDALLKDHPVQRSD